jgi:hypothetical protein
MEPFKEVGKFICRNTRSGIGDCKFGEVRHRAQCYANLTLERKFEGVGKEVENNLLPHVTVDIYRIGDSGAVHNKGQSCAFNRGAEHTRKVGRQRRQVHRLIGCFDAAGLDPGEIQEAVHEFVQPLAIATGYLETFTILGPQFVFPQDVIERTHHQR